MDIQRLKDALMGIKDKKADDDLSDRMGSPEIPFSPLDAAATEQTNSESEGPNTKTKDQLIKDQVEQEAAKTVPGQIEQARDTASVPNNPAPQSQLQKLQEQMSQLRTDDDAKISEARDSDRNRMMLANAIKGLGTLGQAELQRKSGVSGGIDKFQAVKGQDTASALVKDRDSKLSQLQNQLKMMQGQEITPYQQAMLDEKGMDRTAAQKREETKAASKAQEGKKKTKLEETREKNIGNRFDELQGQIPNRMANIEEAKALSELIENDELDTGPGSKMAGEVGAFFDTEESTYKQRLDSLAEKAARSQLKANGEVRPTDADVEGMKKAMFNLGNTEAANVKKLKDFVKQQESGLNEYEQMKEQLATGEGLEDFRLEPTFKNEPKSTGKYGDTVERNGKQYKWNPKAGKYQPLM